MSTKKSKIVGENYVEILSYQVNDKDDISKYDKYLEALCWFIKFYKSNSRNKISMKMIAAELDMDYSLLSKKLNHGGKNRDKRPITDDEINRICEILDFPLSSILFLYQYKNNLPNSFENDSFNKLTNILRGNFEEISYKSIENSTHGDSQLSKNNIKRDRLSQEKVNIDPVLKKWYFYFPSNISDTTEERKQLSKEADSSLYKDSDIKELIALHTPDNIFGGILQIECKDQTYHIKMKYMSDYSKKSISYYSGTLSAPVDNYNIFASLSNDYNNEIIYMIMNKASSARTLNYLMASFLRVSEDFDEEKRRPRFSRMIFSRKPINYDSPAYIVMSSNLMMNSSYIKIDSFGYEQLKNNRDVYNSTILNDFLDRYPTFASLTNNKLVIKQETAYIRESDLAIIANNSNEKDLLYLDALLRRHTIVPWCSKVKSSKVNQALKAFHK